MDKALEQIGSKDYNQLDIEPLDFIQNRLESFISKLKVKIDEITKSKEAKRSSLDVNILVVTHGEIFSNLLEVMLKGNSSLEFPYWPRNLQVAKLSFQLNRFNLIDIDFNLS